MKYIVHDILSDSIKEYSSLSECEEFDRKQFHFLLKIGDTNISSGKTVWEIRP